VCGLKNRIKEFRARFDLRQEDLARKLRVTRQTINAIEKGRYSPNLDLAFKIAGFFSTTLEEIFIYEA